MGLPDSTCLFIMLNPSTADEVKDDPTIRRCIGFANAWGYGILEICNLFAWRATRPNDLKAAEDPVGPENDRYILEAAGRAEKIVAAWGNHGQHFGRSVEARALLRGHNIECLGVTQLGEPKHPLYVLKGQQPARNRLLN